MHRVEAFWRQKLIEIKKAALALDTERLVLIYIMSERKLKDTYRFVYS